MDKEILMAITAFISLLTTQYFQYRKTTSVQNLVSSRDKKQDKEIKEIKTKLDNLFEFVGGVEQSRLLKNKIRIECNTIINNNMLDNSEFISLLTNARDQYLYLIDTLINNNIKDIDINNVKSDIITLAKSVETTIKYNNLGTNEGFRERLKNEIVMPNMEIFAMRLNDEILQEKKKFNGVFSKMALGVIKGLITETIKLYRDCKKIK